jgi:hypothetical protein
MCEKMKIFAEACMLMLSCILFRSGSSSTILVFVTDFEREENININ